MTVTAFFIFRAHFTVPCIVLEVLSTVQFNSVSQPVTGWMLSVILPVRAYDTSVSWSCLCLPCGPPASMPVTTHCYPLPSPVLTPSSLPWQTHLCPSLPLSLQIRLLDSRIYISDLDLLSRFYTHRHSRLEMKCSVLSVSETPLLSTSLVKLMTFAPVSGFSALDFKAAS